MRLLVLGGTRFVGRALVADALDRGWEVTALHRGVTAGLTAGAHELLADRTDPTALTAALGTGEWDLVVDTWAAAPRVATLAAEVLRGRAARYGYVSTTSVYAWGQHVDESSPLVEGDPQAEQVEYAADKRGAELGVLASFPDALLARAGLILGPHEDIGRLPWIQLPCWVPEAGEFAGFLEADTARAAATGLHCRPVQETVADTWAWLQRDGMAAQRPDRPVHGVPPELEQRLLTGH